MNKITKIKEWINQNAPMLAHLYENKYVGMVYDRFASLPANRQRQVILGSFAGIGLIVFGVLFGLYLSFWGEVSKADKAQAMMDMLLKFQKSRRAQEVELAQLERNKNLAGNDGLKNYLVEQGKLANISPRMIKAEERPEAGEDAKKGSSDVRLKQASVRLEKINLSQLRDFLKNVEFGPYSVIVSSVNIANDDKLRGYMNVEVGVVAYLFKGDDEGAL